MKKCTDYILGTCLLLFVVAATATSVIRLDIKSKGTQDGTTSHSNVVCTLKRDVGNILSGTVVLTGDLEDGWVKVDVIKDGVSLYYGGSIAGEKYDKSIKRTVFTFEIHENALKESKVVIGSFHSAILTLPLKGVKITATRFAPDLSATQEAERWAREYERADRELNLTFQKLLNAQDGESRKKLREAQRRWVAFRDAEQAYVEQEWDGGSGQAAARNSALTILTRDRTRQLKERF